jgi:hypothetical protein
VRIGLLRKANASAAIRSRPTAEPARSGGEASIRVIRSVTERQNEGADLGGEDRELRELGMSVTQATRVIAYREREGGFTSPGDLATVPGISKAFLSELRDQLTA